MRIVDPPRDEPPYFVDVLAVEAIEQIWIPSEPCAVTVHARTWSPRHTALQDRALLNCRVRPMSDAVSVVVGSGHDMW